MSLLGRRLRRELKTRLRIVLLIPPWTSTLPPPAPTTYTSTLRAPLSTPPIQQSISTQPSHQPNRRSVSHSIASRVTQHTMDPVQIAVKPSTGCSGSSVAHPSTTVQPTVVPKLTGPVPFATMASRSTSTSLYWCPGSYTYQACCTHVGQYYICRCFKGHAARSIITTANNVQQSVPTQQNTTSTVPSTTIATQSARP